MVPFFLILPKAGDDFSQIIYCENMVDLPLEYLTLSFICIEPPIINWLEVRFFYSGTWSCSGFQFVNLCLYKLTPCIHMSVSQIVGQQLSCALLSLTDTRKIADLFISLSFHLLGYSGNFKAPCMWNRKEKSQFLLI